MADPVEVTVDPGGFHTLLGKSSALDPKLKSFLRKQIKQAAEPAARDVRREVMKSQETVSKHPAVTRGLRGGIAEGITVRLMTGSTRQGVAITASPKSLDEDQKSLVRAWSARKGFRHPTFGNRGQWVTQVGNPGYFADPVYKRRDEIRKAVEKAMADALKTLK